MDQECINCDACVLAAENHFKLLDDGHAYVSRQPTTNEEKEACEEALESCPVEAIGNDGGETTDKGGQESDSPWEKKAIG